MERMNQTHPEETDRMLIPYPHPHSQRTCSLTDLGMWGLVTGRGWVVYRSRRAWLREH
jgi:hypothetical protein